MPSGLSPLRNPVRPVRHHQVQGRLPGSELAYGLAGAGAAIGIAALPRPRQLVVVLCRAFVAVALAAADLSRTLGHDHVRGAFGAVSGALAAAMLVCPATMALGRRAGSGSFGLVERIFYLSMTAWLVTVAVLIAST